MEAEAGADVSWVIAGADGSRPPIESLGVKLPGGWGGVVGECAFSCNPADNLSVGSMAGLCFSPLPPPPPTPLFPRQLEETRGEALGLAYLIWVPPHIASLILLKMPLVCI
jgi:hypothetical protein